VKMAIYWKQPTDSVHTPQISKVILCRSRKIHPKIHVEE
jgi:hypothetical protein